ncbi:hyaluronan mediated motility receptor-like [Chenopodium quinoa]|uniref:hyaluronan mediated motility receptor-like n=1 Tax=Chenopodium quinoa TaxID=63459 RepID=UPI000B77DDCB|nr:hyaluronan mediated motility receptor-like [Chenopodium quinoa]
MEPGLFKKTTLPLDDGTQVIVPKFWVPHPDWFKNEVLLSACEKGLEMVPPEKTPAKSTAEIRKEQLEKKKAQPVAKDDGTESKNVPRSLRQMMKRPGEELSQPASQRRRVPATLASVGRPPAPDRPTSAGKSLRDLGLNSGPAEARTGEPEVPSSRVLTVASGSNAAGGGVTPQPENQDAFFRWPDLQNYAKRILRTLTQSEKEAVPGINQVNIECINSLLAEVMLRVDGMKVPLRKKQEEVRDAQRRAADLIDVTQYKTIMYELETKRREMKQGKLIKELTAAAEEANKKAADFDTQVNNLKADVKALGEVDKENTKLKAEVTRLKNELAQTQTEHKDQLVAEQDRLVTKNERDCEERMKMT